MFNYETEKARLFSIFDEFLDFDLPLETYSRNCNIVRELVNHTVEDGRLTREQATNLFHVWFLAG